MTTDLATGEITGESDLLPAVVDQRAVPSFSLMEMADALTTAETLKKAIMRQGVDYGTIPGVKKPSLWKPGAERACQFYGLSHRMERVEVERDKDGDRLGVTYKCCIFKVLSDGREVPLAECEGYAGYDEDRFWDSEKVWSDKEKRKVAVLGEDGKPKRSKSPWNSVLKMADKRAYVGAVLKATGMSDFFTQDVEDYSRGLPDYQPPPPPGPTFLRPEVVAKVKAGIEEAKMTAAEVQQMLDRATVGRANSVEEVHEGPEFLALRKAKVEVIGLRPESMHAAYADEQTAEPEPEPEAPAPGINAHTASAIQAEAKRRKGSVSPCTPAQRTKVIIILEALVGRERHARLKALEDLIGHPITSSSDLTFGEASALINAFEKDES